MSAPDKRAGAEGVLLADLRPGDTFTPAYGGHYRFDRRDGANPGIVHATLVGGRPLTARPGPAMFGNCATVVRGRQARGWLER